MAKLAEGSSFLKEIRSDSSKGIPIADKMTLSFHTMSYPTARLVWHCPYICIFSSSNGQVSGANYREYLLLKMDGENWEPAENVENQVIADQTEAFEGWDSWKEINKHGLNCMIDLRKDGNKVYIQTENAGIAINSTTTIFDGTTDVFIAITGDQCAITDIRIAWPS